MTTERHLSSEEVAAYLDDTLSVDECERIKAHIADCDRCRAEVVSVSRLLGAAPRSSRRYLTLSALAAAAVVAIVVGRVWMNPERSNDTQVRGSASAPEGIARIRAIAPVDDPKQGGDILFAWHPQAEGAVYRLTVTDARGTTIWSGNTSDTTFALPKREPPLATGTYHWYVDVMQADGTPATTGLTTFQIVP
jgi:hypothetical protein